MVSTDGFLCPLQIYMVWVLEDAEDSCYLLYHLHLLRFLCDNVCYIKILVETSKEYLYLFHIVSLLHGYMLL